MSDDAPKVPDTFEEAERFKRLFVDPAVNAMGQEIKSHLAPIIQGQRKLFAQMEEQNSRDIKQDNRLAALEGSNKKAMVGWGVFATGLSIALSAGWNWITKMFKHTPIIALVVMLFVLGCSKVETVSIDGDDGSGSGFVQSDGIVVTANHVANQGHLVVKKGATTHPATIVSQDPIHDVAVLSCKVTGHASVRRPKIGEHVRIVGFIFDTARFPIKIQADGKVIGGPGVCDGGALCYVIEGAAGPGMSGCPVIGDDGKVVGIILGYHGAHTLIRMGIVEGL